jgi:chaperonin GroEL
MRGNMKIAAVKAPRYGEERRQILSDLAISLGATFVTRESGMQLTDVKRTHLGFAKMCESGRSSTTFMGGNGDPSRIRERIDILKEEIERTQDLRDCEKIQERISRLQSAVAIIRVGGATEIDMIERKDRVIDALEAVKSAQAEGILAGGGTSLVYFSNLLENKLSRRKDLTDDERIGYKIVIEAMRDPLRTIASNCGLNAEVILNDVRRSNKFGVGYNFSNGKYGSLLKQGVIDPAKVTRCALENAISAASTLLTTSHAIVET